MDFDLLIFEGDYWVSEAEVIIKDINNENVEQLADENDATAGNNFKTKKRKKSKQRPTRSARGSLIPAVKSERDPVMTRLSGEIRCLTVLMSSLWLMVTLVLFMFLIDV